MAPSGISLNKPAAISILLVVVGGLFLYRWHWSSANDVVQHDNRADEGIVDIKNLPRLPAAEDKLKLVGNPSAITIEVPLNDKTIKVYSQQISGNGKAVATVLLLHGAHFTSQNWTQIHTLHYLAAWGFHAVAIDLPGYGKSEPRVDSSQRGQFMAALVQTLKPERLIIISPSMSGSYSLPYLFANRTQPPTSIIAFVPVAPAQVEDFVQQYPSQQIPTLIVYGENDSSDVKSRTEKLGKLPKSQLEVIPQAGHACYLDNPPLFHKVLHKFLSQLKLNNL